jgi:hypothetical protein
VSKGLDWVNFKLPSPFNLDTGSESSTTFWIGVQASPSTGAIARVGFVGTKRSSPFTMRHVPHAERMNAPVDTIKFDRKSFVEGDVVVLAFHSAVTRVLLETFLTNAWLRLRSNEMAFKRKKSRGGFSTTEASIKDAKFPK